MKILVVITVLVGLSLTSKAQKLQNLNFYLNHPSVSKAAKDFYNKKFKASDDKRTFSIFDSLNTKNDLTRPFYIFLCTRIMERSDGALSESAGYSAKKFIEGRPDSFINFFNSPNSLLKQKSISGFGRGN